MTEHLFNSIPEWFRRTRAGREALAEAAADRLARRRGLLAEIEAIEQKREKERPKLMAAKEKAKEKAIAAARAHREALADFEAAGAALQGFELGCTTRLSKLEAELRQDADPLIAAFQEQCREEFERLRRSPLETAEVGERSFATGRRRVVSNRASVEARLEGLTKAIRAAESLKVDAGEDLEDRLGEILSNIPDVQGVDAFMEKHR